MEPTVAVVGHEVSMSGLEYAMMMDLNLLLLRGVLYTSMLANGEVTKPTAFNPAELARAALLGNEIAGQLHKEIISSDWFAEMEQRG